MPNSNAKGKRGELEFAKFLQSHGFEARRGQQYSGGDDSPDVVHSIPGIHFEVKRTERLQLYDAMQQAIEDSNEKTPIVAHRKNRQDWVVVMRAEDLITLLKGRCDEQG